MPSPLGLNGEIMSAAGVYGGWVSGPSISTGVSSMAVLLVGWMTAASAALPDVGTGGTLSIDLLKRNPYEIQHAIRSVDVDDVEVVRTPIENLARIREVLKPAISDLASALGVSRQSVYNWLNGEQVADENAHKLKDLANAADVLANEGISVSPLILKRKFVNGKTLMQVVQAGESARDAAIHFVQIHQREIVQRERLATRFANRAKTPLSADFDLPFFNDRV